MKAFYVAAALAAIAVAAPASAQDWNLNPTYGQVSLRADFTPDPYNVQVTSGGSIRASDRLSNCSGYVANAPDFRLHWDGTGNLPLIISANSRADTTLVINGPDGQWWCDDDSGEGTNPSIRFTSPRSGQYDIWVGNYTNENNPATLSISELYSH